MPRELQILEFEIQGTAYVQPPNTEGQENSNMKGQNSFNTEEQKNSKEELDQVEEKHKATINAVTTFNKKSDQIAQEIEEEVKSMLPPFTTVRAEVRFSKGSLVISGTLVILSWLGSIALKSTKDTIEEQLSGVIRLAVQRVLTRTLNSMTNFNIRFTAPEVAVAPQTSTSPEPRPAIPPMASPVTLGEQFLATSNLVWIILAIVVLIQVLILFDHFFTIAPKP